MITWTEEEEEEERQQQKEGLLMVLLVTKKREKKKERGGKETGRKGRKAAWKAEHVRFHMTSVCACERIHHVNVHCSVPGRKGAGEKERERDGESQSPEGGLYAREGLARTARPRPLSEPPPISAEQLAEPQGEGTGWEPRGGEEGRWCQRCWDRPVTGPWSLACPRWARVERARRGEPGRTAGDIHVYSDRREGMLTLWGETRD